MPAIHRPGFLLHLRRIARAFCLGVSGVINPPIGQSLVAGHAKQIGGAFCIRDLKRCAAIIPEIELGKVAVQVCLAAMLIDSDHAALEHREHAFDRSGVNHDVASSRRSLAAARITALRRMSSEDRATS